MKKTTLTVFAACMVFFSHAQSANQSLPTNTGHFDLQRKSANGKTMQVNVNYAISTEKPTNTLVLYLNTPIPTVLSAKILDSKGAAIMSWSATQEDRNFEKQFDLSNLKAGKYTLNIYEPGTSKAKKSIRFEKQNATN